MIILKIVRNSPQCPLSVVADATLNFGLYYDGIFQKAIQTAGCLAGSSFNDQCAEG